MTSGAWLYILRCADGSYYVGTTRTTLELRIAEHSSGHFGGDAAARNARLSARFDQITEAIAAERQIKGWPRAKKEALIRGDFEGLRRLAKRKPKPEDATNDSSSFETHFFACEEMRLEGWATGASGTTRAAT